MSGGPPVGPVTPLGQVTNEDIGRAVVECPGCGQERWHGYGPCTACGAPGTAVEVVHACPPGDDAVTTCCGRSPFELAGDRMSLDPELVTCRAGAGRQAIDGAPE